MDDDSVANNAGGFFVEDSGGEEVEFVFFAFDDDGVACVGSAGDAGAYVVFLGSNIMALSFRNGYCKIMVKLTATQPASDQTSFFQLPILQLT
jgi:hypothetical protein